MQMQADSRNDSTVDLVIGNEWKGLKSESEVPQVKPYVRPTEKIQLPCEGE